MLYSSFVALDTSKIFSEYDLTSGTTGLCYKLDCLMDSCPLSPLHNVNNVSIGKTSMPSIVPNKNKYLYPTTK